MKKIAKGLGSFLLLGALVLLLYFLYLFGSYNRIEDSLPLEIRRGSGETALPVGEPLCLLSYNVGFGAYSADYSFFMDGGKESRARSPEAVGENLGGALEAICQENPDLLLLQEVDEDGTRSHHIDEREIFWEAFPTWDSVYAENYHSAYLFWPPYAPHGANRAGNLSLSRFPIAGALRRSLPVEDGFMKILDLDRCYSKNRIPTSQGNELVLYNVHLSAYTSDGKIAEEQMKMLFADMLEEQQAGHAAIAGGDFNKDLLGNAEEVFGISAEGATWAQPVPEELLPEGLRLVTPFTAEKPVASCRNADRPYGPDDFLVTVDGFVLSDNVELLDSAVVDTGFRWSDHNPVTLQFLLKERP